MWSELLAGAVGGVFTGIVIPYTSYYITRRLNRSGVSFGIDPVFRIEGVPYSAHSITVINNSRVTLKRATAFIIVHYRTEDISMANHSVSYNTNLPGRQLMLSWAQVVDDKNEAHQDINQGDVSDLNLIRYYSHSGDKQYLEIASESGFYNNKGGKARMNLVYKSYNFELVLTAENMTPLRRSFYFDHSDILINARKI
jgi:hypothetical protein